MADHIHYCDKCGGKVLPGTDGSVLEMLSAKTFNRTIKILCPDCREKLDKFLNPTT